MKKILVATNNEHKIEEIGAIIKPLGLEIELVSPKVLGSNVEPIEDGLTYGQNALIKAHFYHEIFHLPTIADDSGLCIEYFANYPNIHSARFLSNFNNNEKNLLICRLMKGVHNRNAYFDTVLAYIDDFGKEKLYQGHVNGKISETPKGDGGFGYDPIFITDGYSLTNAELGSNVKNQISHRYFAIKEWAQDVQNQQSR